MNNESELIHLKKLEKLFKDRYESFKILKYHTYTTKAWKRAWLDVKKEIRKIKNEKITCK